MEQLINQYIKLIKKYAYSFKTNRICEVDDYIQIGLLTLINCVKTYKQEKGAFSTYLTKSVIRAINKERKKFEKKPELLDEIYIELDKLFDKDINKDLFDILLDLDEKNRQIFIMRMAGYKLKEIGDSINLSKETVRKKLLSIREKNNDFKS